MSDPAGVPAKGVIAAYREMLAEAQERNALLTAQVHQLQGQLALASKPSPSTPSARPPAPKGK